MSAERQSFIAKRRNDLYHKRPKEEAIVHGILNDIKARYPVHRLHIVYQASRLVRKYGLFYFDFTTRVRGIKGCKSRSYIEVDGSYHKTQAQRVKDALKQEAVRHRPDSHQYQFIRIDNAECKNTKLLTQKLEYLLGLRQ
jgi:hypothetical protein